MSQIFTGTGLGLQGSSLSQLGAYGPQGNAIFGQNGLSLYINAANGNLILKQSDGFLSSQGIGFNLFSTYNAQGKKADRWLFNTQTHLIIHGEPNSAGGSLTRIGEDGHHSRFVFDSASKSYLPEDGGTERIQWTGSGWSYSQGALAVSCEYNAEGLLTAWSDRDGHRLNYVYNHGQLSDIFDCTGQQNIHWQFQQGLLQDISFYDQGLLVHHLHYNYDDSGRLRLVIQDQGDGKSSWVAYDYQDDSDLIESIRQSDGCALHFSYDEQNRVSSMSDGEGRITRFNYEPGCTKVSNQLGETWCYSFDDKDRLTEIRGPDNHTISYQYQGNYLSRIVKGGLAWNFIYNEAGDCIRTEEPDGQIIQRTFDAEHRLLSESKSSVFNGDNHSGQTATAHYIYDSKGHLRFAISDNGTVTEYRYNEAGACLNRRIYLKSAFDSSLFSDLSQPDLNDLESWSKRQPAAQISLVEYQYDWRGQLQQEIHYQSVDAAGNGFEQNALRTYYQYDARGRLIEKTVPTEWGNNKTYFFYDDLGRLTCSRDNLGLINQYEYDDSHQRIIQTDSRGLKTLYLYDRSGLLLSKQQLGTNNRDFGVQRFEYDKAGRLISETDWEGRKSWYLYDKTGLLCAKVDNNGHLKEYRYDAEGRLIQSIEYAQKVNEQQLGGLELELIRPTHSSKDRYNWTFYNQYNQIAYQVDATGAIIGYRYDAQGQLTEKIAYAERIAITNLFDAIKSGTITPVENANDRRYRYYYDIAGRLQAEINAEGTAIGYQYDRLGNCIEVRKFYNKAIIGDLKFWGEIEPAASDKDIVNYSFYNSAGLKEADIDGEGFATSYYYNNAGMLLEKRQYFTALSKPLRLSFDKSWEDQKPNCHPKDRITSYRYDERQLLIEENQSGGLTLNYFYDNSGLMLEKRAFDRFRDQIRGARYQYDERGRLIASLSAEGEKLLRNIALSKEEIAAIWQQHAVHYSYSNNDSLLTKTNALGQTERYVYDEQGRLAFILNADGEIREQQYDDFGNLTRYIQYSKHFKNLPPEMNAGNLHDYLTLHKDPADEVTEYEYNHLGQVIRTCKGSRLETATRYNAFGEVEQLIQDAQGKSPLTTNYFYDKRGLLVLQQDSVTGIYKPQSWSYDRFGRLMIEVDANQNKTSYKYNQRGECTAVINAKGKEKTMRYDAFSRVVYEFDQLRTIYEYDDSNNSVTIRQPDKGREVKTEFNAFGDKISFTDFNGAITSFTYDVNGQLIEKNGPLGLQSFYTYDRAGQLIKESKDGRITQYSYDAAGRVLSKTIDPEGLNLSTHYHFDGIGRQLEVIGPDQIVKQYRYDNAGNCIRSCIDPSGLNLITEYEYDSQNQLTRQTILNSGGKNQITAYEWDSLGRCTQKIIDPEGLSLVTQYTYDAKGNLCSETDPRGNNRYWIYDVMDECRFQIDARGCVTEFKYDQNGRNICTIQYANEVRLNAAATENDMKLLLKSSSADRYSFKQFDSDGHVLLSFDPMGYATAYTYDVQGNATRIIRYAKPASLEDLKNGIIPVFGKTEAGRVQHLAYDSLNRLCYQLDDEHHLTEFKYNQAGEVVSKTRFANRFLFDLNQFNQAEIEKLISRNLQSDQTSRYSYDQAGRLLAELNAEGFAVKYQYDLLGNLIATQGFAKPVSSVLDENWLSALKSDSYDRITRSVFDAAGREIYRISAEGRVIGRQYDAVGNIISETSYAARLNLSEYSEESLALALQNIQGRTSAYQYDSNGRLTNKTDAENQQTVYDYDANGNLISKTEANKAIWCYEYDASNQLITTISPEVDVALGYQSQRRSIITRNLYDNFGNIIKTLKDAEGLCQIREYTFDANNHCVQISYPDVAINKADLNGSMNRQELRKTLNETFRYNAFGEVEAQSDRAGNWQYFTYDREGHLRFSLNQLGALTEYEYNDLGQLAGKTTYATGIYLKPGSEVNGSQLADARKTNVLDRHEFYQYDRLNRLIKTEKDSMRSFNSSSRSYEFSTPTTRYQYNAFGEVINTAVLLHEGVYASSRRYYDRDGLLTGELNAENYLTRYQYNAFVELSQQTEYAERASCFDDFDVKSPVNTSLDRVFLYQYDALGRVQRKTQRQVTYQQLNSNGQLVNLTADIVNSYEYDSMGHLVKMTDAEGQSSYFSYDALGQLKAKMGPQTQSGRAAVSYTYDGLGHLIETIQYANGAKLDSEGFILPAASANDLHTLDFYDSNDQLLLQQDAMGHLKFYSYDEQGNIARAWELLSQIDGSQRLIDKRYFYDAGGHLLRAATRKANGDWACEDSQYNVFGEVAHKGINGQLNIHYDYDQAGRLWRTNSAGYYQLFIYDLSDKVTQIITSTNAFRPAAGEDGVDLSDKHFETARSFQTESWEFDLQRQNNLYDKLGNLLAQNRESTENPLTINDSVHLKTINQTYSYDRWGNVLSHRNANGYETNYQYNGLNQLTEQELPQVMAYDEHGVGRLINPRLLYAYDRLGRLIGFTDANGHTVTKVLDASGNVIQERDAKGGLRQKYYDIFGRLKESINELGGSTVYLYDKANRLTGIQTSGSKQQYFYDEAGQLLQQTDGENNASLFVYDELGNLIGKRNTFGYWRSMTYDDAGHKLAETDELGHVQSWSYQDGRLISHTDLGQHQTTYRYNRNGLLLSESGSGRSIEYHYQGDGSLKQYVDNARGEVLNYQYDNEGNVSSKQSSRINPGKDGWLLESDHYEYDSLGRLISVRRAHPDDVDSRFPQQDKSLLSIDYQYDAAGNLRHSLITANYGGYEKASSDEYYSYDENNRIKISKGKLIEGNIQIDKDQGSLLDYDAAGNLTGADKYEEGILHHYLYGYNKGNQLKWTQKDNLTLESRKYNQAGQVIEDRLFDAKGNVAQINRSSYKNGFLDYVTTTRPVGNLEHLVSQNKFYYDVAENLTAEMLRVEKQGQNAGYTLTHVYSFDWWDDYRRSEDRATLSIDNQASTHGLSMRIYDVNGQLQDAIDQQPDSSGRTNSAHYSSSAVDGIRSREDQTGKTSYLSVNGKHIADIKLDATTGRQTLTVYGGFTPEGSAHPSQKTNPWIWNPRAGYGNFNAFFQNGRTTAESMQARNEPNDTISPNSPQDNLGSYTVSAGDTLESIALQVYGDSSLWYLIADANGITSREERAGSSSQMHAGQRLVLPPVFSNQHNSADTHNVLREDYFIGNTSATAPMPKPLSTDSSPVQRKHHKLLGKVLTAVVGTIITVLAAAAVASIFAPSALAINGLGGIFKLGLSTLWGGSSLGVSLGASLSAGFIGNMASQGVASMAGLQEGMHWGAALTTALATMASAGLMRGMKMDGFAKDALGFLSDKSPALFNFSSAAEMMSQNALSQGITLAANQQKHFDWQRLAASGVTAGLMGGEAGGRVSNALRAIDKTEMINTELNSLLNQGSHALLTGQSINTLQILEDNLGDSIGQGIMKSAIQDSETNELDTDNSSSSPEDSIESLYLDNEESILLNLNENSTAQSILPPTDPLSLATNNELDLRNTLTDLYNYGKNSVMDRYNSLTQGLNDLEKEYNVRSHFYDILRDLKSEPIDNTPSWLGDVGSLGMDFIPIIGQVKAITEIYTGHDLVTGQEINRGLAFLSLIPGTALAIKPVKFLSKTKAGKVISTYKATIIRHSANAAIAGGSSYGAAVSTGDEHPIQTAILASAIGLAVGYKVNPSRSNAAKINFLAGGTLSSINQKIDSYKTGKPVSVTKVIINATFTSLGAAWTFGMPVITAAMLRFQTETPSIKIGEELYDRFNQTKA